MEVMMTAPGAGAGKGAAGETDVPGKLSRMRGLPLERTEILVDQASTSNMLATPTSFRQPSRSWQCQLFPVLILH
jgi:hypothetical protein